MNSDHLVGGECGGVQSPTDAERYQWLMNNCGFGIRRNGTIELSVAFYKNEPDNIGDMSAAIDAAILTRKGGAA